MVCGCPIRTPFWNANGSTGSAATNSGVSTVKRTSCWPGDPTGVWRTWVPTMDPPWGLNEWMNEWMKGPHQTGKGMPYYWTVVAIVVVLAQGPGYREDIALSGEGLPTRHVNICKWMLARLLATLKMTRDHLNSTMLLFWTYMTWSCTPKTCET